MPHEICFVFYFLQTAPKSMKTLLVNGNKTVDA
jgi:hypothetical protein